MCWITIVVIYEYNMLPRGRRQVRRKRLGGRRPARKQQYGGRRRQVQGLLHRIKRLGAPVMVQNDAFGTPHLSQDGSSSFSLAGVAGDVLPGTNQFGMSAQFQLSSVVDPADLTDLFDRYKITGVALKFQFLNNNGLISGKHNLPTIYYAWDGDDAATPISANTVLTKAYCKTKVLNANTIFKAYIKPRVTKELFNGTSIVPGYSSERAPFIDCSSSSVPHYGMKFWITNWLGGESNIALRIQPTYYLAMRDTQ